ncbi:MAG: site-specific integrase [Acidobacteria bacterium]|nr:site-specific integrase [Acidobacteriota bacterium]
MLTRITEKTVKKLRPPQEGNAIVWDREIPGFGVRITSKGVVSFVLNYRLRARERRYTIGRFPVLSPTAARNEAIKLRGNIQNGIDPLAQRADDRSAPTMVDLAHDYMERHAKPYKRPKSISSDRSMIDSLILPRLGRHKVSSVTRRDLENIHRQLKPTPYQANRVLALLSKMFSLAQEWGWSDRNPTRGIPKYQEQKRTRWLSPKELSRLLPVLDRYARQDVANAVRLLLLTGAREGELLSSTWDQFNLPQGFWTKPSHHTKQKRTEHTPLSAAALAILNKMAFAKNSTFLFPGRKPGQHLKKLTVYWIGICKTAKIEGVRIHDLRHTFASHLASSGTSLHIIGRLLGHTQPQTTARYAHLADQPLKEAADRVAEIYGATEKKP